MSYKDITDDASSVISSAKSKVDDLMNARAWTYILVGTSVLTMFVALRNIYVLSERIAKEDT